MVYVTSPLAVGVFLSFVLGVLILSWWLGRSAKSASGYYAAHGQIHWFVNGIAFAGDYLSAASFLGICGMIAFYGYDGFLYSIGYLAGWVVALFVVAEPLKQMGRFTFADALDARFHSRGIKLAAAISTLVVSLFYLIPQMVGAGVLIKPLLGFSHASGVLIVGVVVTIIVVTAGMVSTTWVQFIKGGLLVAFCFLLTVMILRRGFEVPAGLPVVPQSAEAVQQTGRVVVDPDWPEDRWLQVQQASGAIHSYRRLPDGRVRLTQVVTTGGGQTLVDGLPQGVGANAHDLTPVGAVSALPGGGSSTGPLGPIAFLRTFHGATIETWTSEKRPLSGGRVATVYTPREQTGADLLQPGASPTFSGVRSAKLFDKLDFLSLMLALFAGTASLPHILIRYYTVKDVMAVRKSTVVGIGAIGLFYVLTLYLGLGAMTSGALDVSNTNMAAPLLARSFSEPLFAVISAIAFTTVLGTVSGLILAASGAVVHDLLTHVWRMELTDDAKVRAGKLVAVVVGIVAMLLGIAFEKLNVSFLVGWAFNVAASANLPSLVMLLFWKRTTKQGIVAAIMVGMASSLGWILASAQAYKDVYGWPPEQALVPFSQPGIVTIPLGFLVLIVVSLLTPRPVVRTA
ncbi:cation acetate symporter [Luteitalea sp. TBR-22]|uniref:solute symporter family protein n=1 Tax=Luteitalea sp. TBR-22 TaxID=2802971 RepID=UPI001AF3300F|nr:cation acetate symporter [Luteitalea sp. TBR-22]BCS34294.1 cation acetate symporter [Luteitalea sp. TBR-22]